MDLRRLTNIVRERCNCWPMRGLRLLRPVEPFALLRWARTGWRSGGFMQRSTIAHVRNWQEHRRVTGTGHLYQGDTSRFLSRKDEHFLRVPDTSSGTPCGPVCRERQQWRWGSLWRRCGGECEQAVRWRRGRCRPPGLDGVGEWGGEIEASCSGCGPAFIGGGLTVASIGNSVLPSNLGWNRHTGERASEEVRRRLIATFLRYTHVLYFTKTGPVPLSSPMLVESFFCPSLSEAEAVRVSQNKCLGQRQGKASGALG